MTNTALFQLKNLSLGYHGQAVLERISFAVERGEFLALLGPNGAGKTTLLRGLLGLIPVLAGRIEYGFNRLAHPPGYVPQRETLDPIFPLTVFEVVLMGTYARLGPLHPIGQPQRRLTDICLEQVGLVSLSSQPFWTLSGGQKQRVLIARALAAEPEVLMLDEPTSGVDPGAATTIMNLISRLNQDQKLTVLLVSHHLRLVRSLVRSIVWVEEGRAVKGPTKVMLTPERVIEGFGTVPGVE